MKKLRKMSSARMRMKMKMKRSDSKLHFCAGCDQMSLESPDVTAPTGTSADWTPSAPGVLSPLLGGTFSCYFWCVCVAGGAGEGPARGHTHGYHCGPET